MSPISRAALALGVGVLSVALAGCGSATTDARPDASGSAPPGEWTRLPDSPLSPREGPAAAHVPTADGDLAVFVGGYTGAPCPPGADCSIPEDTLAADGAAYDVGTGVWRRIADAPVTVSPFASTAVVDGTLYVLTDGHLIAWDSVDDTWTELDPPKDVGWASLVADTRAGRPRLVLASSSDEQGARPDQVYDPADGTWSQLPADPLRPSFDRVLVSTPSGLVLTAKPIAPDGGPEDPALVRAAVLPPGASRWRTVPTDGDQLGGGHWTWTGRRLVDPTLGGADGGEVNGYGRTIPYGGALDPATGEWEPLTGAPDQASGGWPVEALGGSWSAAEGWIYRDGDGGDGSSWSRLPPPDDAPAEPGPGVWVGDLLVVAGGSDWDGLDESGGWTAEDVWPTAAWAYHPG